MPNGFAGSQEHWKRAEGVLSAIDSFVAQHLQDREFTINRNYHSWPCRSVEWTTGHLQRNVQVFLSSEKDMTYDVKIRASRGTGSAVLQHEEFLRKNVPWETLSKELRHVLIQAVKIVDSWTADDLTRGPNE